MTWDYFLFFAFWHHHSMENKITNKWVETAVVAVYICITCMNLQYCCHSIFKFFIPSRLFQEIMLFLLLVTPIQPTKWISPCIPLYLTNDLFQLLVSFLSLHFYLTYSAKERNEKISRTIYSKKNTQNRVKLMLGFGDISLCFIFVWLWQLLTCIIIIIIII